VTVEEAEYCPYCGHEWGTSHEVGCVDENDEWPAKDFGPWKYCHASGKPIGNCRCTFCARYT